MVRLDGLSKKLPRSSKIIELSEVRSPRRLARGLHWFEPEGQTSLLVEQGLNCRNQLVGQWFHSGKKFVG